MATEVRVSELNEITSNSDINQIIVNDRESVNDTGITKKIQMCNFLTSNIVKESNIINSAVTRSKIAELAIDCSRIANNTITCNQIQSCTITSDLIAGNAVDSRILNSCCGFDVKSLVANNGPIRITDPNDGCLAVESGITKLNTQTYYWPGGQSANKFLHTNGVGQLSWQDAVPGDSTSLVFKEIMPVGTIIPWAGAGSTPSDGKWLPCNGAMFLGSEYPELSAALLDIWGARDTASGKFFLPNLNGRVPMGAGDGVDINGTVFSHTFRTNGLSNLGGEASHKLTSTESGLPYHRHQLGIPRDSHGSGNRLALTDTPNSDEGVLFEHFSDYQQADAQNFHNNLQPYTLVRYIIKAKPDDVQQFNPVLGPGLSATDVSGQTANMTLTSIEIGVKLDNNNIVYNSTNSISLANSISATSITFDDGSVQNTASLVIAGSVNADGTPNTGTGFTSTRNSEGRYTITLPDPGTGMVWMVTANSHSVNLNNKQWYSSSFAPHTVELAYTNSRTIQLNVKLPSYHGAHVAQFDDALVNFIAVKAVQL